MRAMQEEPGAAAAAKKAAEPARAAPAPAAANNAAATTARGKKKRRFPYRKVEDLEADIAAEETRLRELEALIASTELYRDGNKVKETMQAFEDCKAKLKQLYEHWEEAVELN